MLRVNDKEWEIEINGFQVGKKFGSLRIALQKSRGYKEHLLDSRLSAAKLWD